MDGAATILDKILAPDENRVDQAARNHFNRASAYELKFELAEAIPHYEKAYRYGPNEFMYASYYALLLLNQHQYGVAEVVWNNALRLARDRAFLPDVATTLNNRGLLFWYTKRLKEAESDYTEALGIQRQLATENPAAFLPNPQIF